MNKYLKLKEGDVITFINKNGGFVDKQVITSSVIYSFEYLKEKFRGRIIKIERPINYNIIYEEEDILDEVEKKWLGDFVRPFRNNVKCIIKYRLYDESLEWLNIQFKEDVDIELPCFKSNKMYKGMEVNKEYTLEELEL